MKKIISILITTLFCVTIFSQYSVLKVDTVKKNRNPTRVVFADTATIPFNGNRAVTASGLPATNTRTTNVVDFLNAYFFPSTAPTMSVSLTQYSYEFMSAGSALSVNVNYSGTRTSACTPIVSIVVNGISQTLDVPFNQGHTQSGTLTGQTLPRNTNTTFSGTITSQDKSASSSATASWYWSSYWGCFSTGTAPTTGNTGWISNAQIIALGSSQLTTGYAINFGSINCAGTYFVYAFPHSWGTPTFLVNTFPTSFVEVWINQSFTNASGGVNTYDVWVSPFPYAGAFTLVAQ